VSADVFGLRKINISPMPTRFQLVEERFLVLLQDRKTYRRELA